MRTLVAYCATKAVAFLIGSYFSVEDTTKTISRWTIGSASTFLDAFDSYRSLLGEKERAPPKRGPCHYTIWISKSP